MKLDNDTYIADGDYIRDLDINDLRNRYTLTKGSTQKMVIAPIFVSADFSRHSMLCFAAWNYTLASSFFPFPPFATP